MSEVPSVSFGKAIKLFFSNYANFSGRSRRSEYWWAILFLNLVAFGLGALLPEAAGLWSLIILVPALSLLVRRLHDTGRSGWYYFFGMIPLVGQILLLVWVCSDSTEDNQWGPNPKRPSGGYQSVETPAIPSGNSYERTGGSTASAPPYTPPAPAAASNITLRICTGAMAGNAYNCPPGTRATLGRAPSRCEIVLDASYNQVSGVHCRIDFYDRYVTVTDLNSTNGTYVNGTRLTPGQPMTAQSGATIYLANSACAFQVYFS